MVDFLKPNWMKLIFLIELPLFLLIEIFRECVEVVSGIGILVLPAVFFYLVGCTLIFFYKKRKTGLSLLTVLTILVVFLLVDQGAKAIVVNTFSLGESIPLLPGLLHLAYAQNFYGTWLFGGLVSHGVLLALIIVILLAAAGIYRYYKHMVRDRLLADLAFAFLAAGLISAFIEIGLRGFVVDFIQLPGHVTADIKDIYLGIGSSCVLVETFDGGHGKMSLRDFGHALVRMVRYNLYNRDNFETENRIKG